MESGLIKGGFHLEQQAYYDYTCQTGDYIKMCTVPSLQMDESDLVKEKKKCYRYNYFWLVPKSNQKSRPNLLRYSGQATA